MELRQLKYLVSIAEEGTFTAAAEKLFISQSALSQQVKRMEEELGVPLFDRSRNRLQFTEAGELLHHRARKIIKEVEEAKTAIDDLEGLCRGTLSIGVVQTVNAYLIPRVVSYFSREYPKVKLGIEELSAPLLEEKLYNHELDIGISFNPSVYPDLDFERIFSEQLLMIVNPRHKLAQCSSIEVKGMGEEHLLLLSNGYCTRRIWDAAAREAEVEPNVQIEMNTIDGLLSAIQNNTKVGTVLPALTMEMKAAEGLMGIPLENPSPEREVGILWRKGAYRNKASEKFADVARQQYRQLNEE
ncbi:LysR substrate-binding domain-containing protein [Fodinibius halophilus]|uniref:LysR family transcriptional regulator n=1 Tax=Fodinibius halophilus TaxID=1736908 RepID=A0A6M1TEU7_9BACT|nr:LysR substrate-binding domain-containing protein [Fodinibius halophilus]NGP88702.1 LysR family transcriptional regulator [Fodinibius halophilus]